MPPAPKPPKPLGSVSADVADAVVSALGIETAHQRAVMAHTEAMKQWRETVRDLRQQEAAAWEQLTARSAMVPLVQRQRKAASAVALSRPNTPIASQRPHAPR
jgi:hypothetical protein